LENTLKNLALFDFDGTITKKDMLPEFFRLAIPRRRQRIGKIIVAPLIIGYKLGIVSGAVVRAAIIRLGFSSVPYAHYERKGQEFATLVLPRVIRPEALERIKWHQGQGDVVVVVSGALDIYLAPWCHSQGVEFICSTLEHRSGVLTGRYLGAQCVRSEKARQVAARFDLGSFAEVFAYGDTAEDKELLALASRKFYKGQEVLSA
jgi:HAD superfamily hydrolase (TIGR01490 family)